MVQYQDSNGRDKHYSQILVSKRYR